MPFHRFEAIEQSYLTPDLSTARGPVIEGDYLWFCLVNKTAGTGSELHYHPNELLIFPVAGKINAVVGKDRRVVAPGTFVHAPAFARHSMRATEDGDLSYLYMKDKTWTVVGLAVDEKVPERALTIDEINRLHEQGKGKLGERGDGATRHREKGASSMVVDGIDTCFHPVIEGFDAPAISGRRETTIEGERLAFAFVDAPRAGHRPAAESPAPHELFFYTVRGMLEVSLDGERRRLVPGDVMHVRRGQPFWLAAAEGGARYASVRSTDWLEHRIDDMPDDEREQSRLHNRAN
jgi:quercetin dioxygenase-like cupin family protein